jgi:hypothetical protein
MDREPAFNLPGPIGAHVPFEHLHVWQWAKSQPRPDVDLMKYLDSVGFALGRDRLTPEDLKTLDYAIDHFHRTEPHMPGPVPFSEVLTPAPQGFYVQGKPGKFALSKSARSALEGAGWIYDVQPDNTYFQVIHGKLWAKYQQIIGSRALVEVTE